jgi:alcohol dehydrogenase class IV
VAAKSFGRHAFVLTGREPRRSQSLLAQLGAANIEVTTAGISGEPSTTDIVAATAQARAAGCDMVIGFGGGSVLDAAKAVSALLTNPGELLDYLEVIGRAEPLAQPAAPCIAIPTTAGTGAEVTRNAVLASPAHRVKVSWRSAFMLPRLAVVDPELTLELSPALTASTGLDALTQLIEPYVSCRANPLTDALCLEGLRRGCPALRRAFHNGNDLAARTEMAFASLCGGLALANAGLGAVHGFAGPIGGMFPAAHGAVCAALLPHVIETNAAALRSREPDADALRRYDHLARVITGSAHASVSDLVRWIRDLVSELGIPPLSSYGMDASHTPSVVEAAAKASSMKGNPLPLTADELREIFARAL